MAFVTTAHTVSTATADFLHATSEPEDFVLCRRPEKLRQLLDAVKPGSQVHYVCSGDWSTHDLVMELLKVYQPAQLWITTYALREYPVRQLLQAQEKGIIQSVQLIIDYRAKARTPEVLQLAEMNLNKIYLTNIHAKVTVIDSPAGMVTIMGSANWTQNPRIECGVVSLHQGLARFHLKWMQQILQDATPFE